MTAVIRPVAIETFKSEETHALQPYFTNTDRPVFALTNLPETVKGALFARYSRSAKSLRRLFLDEFAGNLGEGHAEITTVGLARADKLHGRWRYHVPAEVEGALRDRYVAVMDDAFETYASLIDGMQQHFAAKYPRAPQDSE